MTETNPVVVLCAISMLFWVYAYILYPAAIQRIKKLVDAPVLGEHAKGARNFVLWCAGSHVLMFFMMMNNQLHSLAEPLNQLFNLFALSYFCIGGFYSIHRAHRLWSDAHRMANDIRQIIN